MNRNQVAASLQRIKVPSNPRAGWPEDNKNYKNGSLSPKFKVYRHQNHSAARLGSTEENRLLQRVKPKNAGSDFDMYAAMQSKLTQIEAKIEQMKANMHRKKIQRQAGSERVQAILEQARRVNRQTDCKKREQKEQDKNETKHKSSADLSKQPIKLPTQMNLLPGSKADRHKNTSLSEYITRVPKNEQESIKMEQGLNGLVTYVPEQNSHILEFNPYSPRSNIYYVSEAVKGCMDASSFVHSHLKASITALNHFANMRIPSNFDVQKRALHLPLSPAYQDKKTLIFDLDQTLIHCNENLSMPHQVEIPITFPNGQVIRAGINIRPAAVETLRLLSKDFELVVFTASHRCYANEVIDYLDPKKELIQHRLYREHCHVTPQGEYIKDLRVINRELRNMVLVDNAAYSYAFQVENGIPIIPYYHGETDYELQALVTYLQELQLCEDVRVVNRKTFRLTKYRDYKPSQVVKLVQELYINKKE